MKVNRHRHLSPSEKFGGRALANVGSEFNGKNAPFSRPVIIYKKLSHGFYFVIPTTTQRKEGSWSVRVRYQRTDMTGRGTRPIRRKVRFG